MIGWLFLGYTILLAGLTDAVLSLEKLSHLYGSKKVSRNPKNDDSNNIERDEEN